MNDIIIREMLPSETPLLVKWLYAHKDISHLDLEPFRKNQVQIYVAEDETGILCFIPIMYVYKFDAIGPRPALASFRLGRVFKEMTEFMNVIGDEVTFNNIYWIALAANSNSQPSTSNGNWQAVGRIEGDVQIFTSSGTWSKPAAGTFAVITCIGGGSGGSGGGKNTAGNGGFAGGISVQTLPLSILGATESVTIGGGGNGGTGSTVASSNPGGSGGTTSFGSWLRAGGGTSSAAGGGNMDNGTFSMQGGNGGNGGGPPNNGSNGADGATARTTPFAGGSGGAGVTNLSGNATAIQGGNGTAASTDEPSGGGGGGGGGGASCGTSSFTATGGNGGNAAIYGAGGGGGGGAASNGPAQGGSGGSGAPGILIVAVY